MTSDKETSAISAKCSVCGENFANSQDCFKHELIKHSLQKKPGSQNRVEKRLNATKKFLNAEQKVKEREHLKQLLNKCKSGQELRIIFDLFCMKTDNLGFIFTRIQTCLEKELRSAGIVQIYPFGSIASGLALRDCDIDIFLDISNLHTSPTHKHRNKNNNAVSHQRKAFNRITNLLHRSTHFTDVFPIRRARVPIIKCKHEDTGFSLDINVSYPSSRENTQFINDLVKSDERIHELMLFLKLWAKNMQIIGRDNMTSYCLITMIMFFLQQPQKTATQTNDNNDNRIIKSIKELQDNCNFHMVQGVNYAYDLNSEDKKPKIPAKVSTWDLIKEFFDFYQKLDFEQYVISPYYGQLVSKTNLTPDICEEYRKQLRTITHHLQGEPANNFQIDCCMCVQDAFCLNQNTAKNITRQNKEYITMCLQNAKKICENPNKLTLGQIYEQLLFDTVKINNNEIKEKMKTEIIANLQKLKIPTAEIRTAIDNNTESKLTHTIRPSRGDLRIVASHCPIITDADEILRWWCQHYATAIGTVITKLYRMDMQKQVPTQQKQQKLDSENADEDLNQSWLIFCTVDLWSNRCFQKHLQTTFMSYQLEQTERLHNLRRQDPKYSVTLNGVLNLNILPNYMGIDIQLGLGEGSSTSSINKKSPLRKFFNIFKNTLQNLTCKDILNTDDTSAINTDNADTVISTPKDNN